MPLLQRKHSRLIMYAILMIFAVLLLIYPFAAFPALWESSHGKVQSQPQEMTSKLYQEQGTAREEQRNLLPATGLNPISRYYQMLTSQRAD